jgi:uncharacterized protein YacL
MSVALRAVVTVLTIFLAARACAASGLSPALGALAGAALALGALVLEARAARARIDRLAWGVAGAVVGIVIGAVVGGALGSAFIAPGVVLGGYLGAAVAVHRGGDVTGVNTRLFPRSTEARVAKLVDTSAIIDGRIADLAATGFIDGPLLVPQFVLLELQQIADASDPRRRARGKRGFDVVQRLTKLPDNVVTIVDDDVPAVTEVDRKLLELAKQRGAKVITTDYNLTKLAELSSVAVLNVNELANAMKPAAMAGDPMHLHVLREGKEAGQGVGYLDDGTMVVVEQGKRCIGQSVDVVVTSVLQTPAGRIIFTRLREEDGGRA